MAEMTAVRPIHAMEPHAMTLSEIGDRPIVRARIFWGAKFTV